MSPSAFRSAVLGIPLLGLTACAALGAEGIPEDLERRFAENVRPFMETHCISCHGGKETKADLDLGIYRTTGSVVDDLLLWEMVQELIEEGEMPPRRAETHPTGEESESIVAWIGDLRKSIAESNAGDPGRVLARRLSNAEYDYTIRDLTGVDIRPAREFPVDPANQAGFDNTGESLAMSPALLVKYLEAARNVANHLVLTPEGIEFAEHPAISETDRDKHGVRKIIAFYQRQPTDLTDYFGAAWRYQHRAELGVPDLTLDEAAAEAQISASYLAIIFATLTAETGETGPIAALQSLWNSATPDSIRERAVRMRDLTLRLREQVKVDVPNLHVRGMNSGAQPLVLWKNRRMADARRNYGGGALELEPAAPELEIPRDEADRERYEEEFRKFCDVFPDAFYISERGRGYLPDGEEAGNVGRLLSAGLHNQMGYFRDDQPLYDMILDDAGRRELDALWDAFYFSSSIPARMHSGHIWHERAESGFIRGEEFEFARPEDKDIIAEPKFSRFMDLYLERVYRATSDEAVIQAVKDHARISAEEIRKVGEAWETAEPKHVAALGDFAQRAWRRQIAAIEREEIESFYHKLRNDGLPHEDSVRDTLVSILMSPKFCYRVDLPGGDSALPGNAEPLTGYELASRLSYFLWSSMPDQELMDSAAAGELANHDTLRAQVRRMLRDDKIGGLAREFAGNWLDFRRFEEHNAVNRERFPAFDNALRQAMFEEPVRFFEDIARNDLPITGFLLARHTFVNGPLAEHYGITPPENPAEWVRVENADRHGRGGLLPMSVFLTRNAPGLRTSPVKRGYWVVRNILGEHIPAPPPDVPELPADESDASGLTLRQSLEKHREDPNCSACHARFDSFGLVFEGYGPVGELRTVDLGGRPVETHAEFPGGGEGAGFGDLQNYLRDNRLEDFTGNLCRKMLSYALSRSLIPSDDATLAAMRDRLSTEDHRFSALVEAIVTSPQFLNKRSANTASAR